MKLKTAARSHHGTMAELNITPLLDLVFVLLVIFIITTPQLVNNLENVLPSGKPTPPAARKPKINHILINDAGSVFLNDEAVAISNLKPALQQLKADQPDPAVVIKAGDDVDYQRMVTVLDTLQQLDITKVGLATAQ